jgi:putative PIN family toxin of toxin-antitoxin system
VSGIRVVLDTNVLLVSISDRSRLHWVWHDLMEGAYVLCVTTEILTEYAEILERHMGPVVSESVLGLLENLPNVVRITTYFRFRLLADEDDNKFVDCAIAANARYLVSHDADFRVLSQVPFPRVDVIDTVTFQRVLPN